MQKKAVSGGALKKLCCFYAACGAFFALCALPPASAQEPQLPQIVNSPALDFTVKPYKENQAGKPGYKAAADLLETRSALYPHAEEIGEYVSGEIIDGLFYSRREFALAEPDNFCDETNRGDDCFNETGAAIESAAVFGSLVSIRYNSFEFPVGAAHPMHAIYTYNFSLKPLFRVESFASLFANEAAALPIVRQKIRDALLAQRDEDGRAVSDRKTIWEGAKDWKDFDTFILTHDGIKILFPPYAVAAYAFGTREVLLPYADLSGAAALKPFYRKALGPE